MKNYKGMKNGIKIQTFVTDKKKKPTVVHYAGLLPPPLSHFCSTAACFSLLLQEGCVMVCKLVAIP